VINHVTIHATDLNLFCLAWADFVRGMIPHHQGAIAMCDVLLNTTQHGRTVEASLLTMCNGGVKPSQTAEVTEMTTWLNSRTHAVAAACPDHSAMAGMAGMAGMSGMAMGCGDLTSWSSKQFEAANMEMHKGMSIKFTCDPNEDFVRGMIPHHQGAIDMCKVLTNTCGHGQTVDGELATLCGAITTAQTTEIATLTAWLESRSKPVAPACPSMSMAMEMGNGCGDLVSWSSKAYIAANTVMHNAMGISYTGNPNTGTTTEHH
jgi:uncharacterized protein (DUF305 family)